jgi:hypothetical protein
MEHQEHYSHNECDVDESTGDVKSEKPKQPKNDQDRCDYPKHVFVPSFRARGYPDVVFPYFRMFLGFPGKRCALTMVDTGKGNVCAVQNTLASCLPIFGTQGLRAAAL